MRAIGMENVYVLSSLGRFVVVGLALSCLAALPLCAQEIAPPQSAASPAKPLPIDFPDNPSGLEHLAKQIIKAQKEGDTALASALAQSMVLPDPANWYLQNFGPDIANDEGAKYTAAQKGVPNENLKFFFGAIQSHFTDVSAARFAENCDDNAGETAFGTLQLRLQPVPLYELRLKNDNQFLRLFALVYVDGGFRFVLAPRVPDHFPYHARAAGNSSTDDNNPRSDQGEKKLRVGGNVQAARVIQRIQPEYPEIARREHLQGTVRLHAIIAKDGSISQLVVLHGYCSLAKSSVNAVKKWRYTPTLLLGQPVEVDTTIDVIFALNY
jgi:protein TonB